MNLVGQSFFSMLGRCGNYVPVPSLGPSALITREKKIIMRCRISKVFATSVISFFRCVYICFMHSFDFIVYFFGGVKNSHSFLCINIHNGCHSLIFFSLSKRFIIEATSYSNITKRMHPFPPTIVHGFAPISISTRVFYLYFFKHFI